MEARYDERPEARERSRSPARAAPAAGKLSGTVKRWNEEKGFGFIVPEEGGDDLFIHRTNIADGDSLTEGSTVHFVKTYDDRKQKERAEQVTGGVTGAAKPAGFGGFGAPPVFSGTPRGAEGKLMGTAKKWNDEKGFGFIIPDDGGDDVFVHRTNIQDGDSLTEGARVAFIKVMDERKGKCRAESVTGASTRAAMPPAGMYGAPPPFCGSAYPPPPYAGGAYGACCGYPPACGGYGDAPPYGAYPPPPMYGEAPAAAPPSYGYPPAYPPQPGAYGDPNAAADPHAGYANGAANGAPDWNSSSQHWS